MEIYTGTKSVVLSLDPRGVILNGGIDVASRQNNYGYQIKSQNNLDFLIISSKDDLKNNFEYKFVKILHISKPTFNFYKFSDKFIPILLEILTNEEVTRTNKNF
jgi:hypothetical protein